MPLFNREPKIQDAYKKHRCLFKGKCAFCDKENIRKQLLKEFKHHLLAKNLFPYASFDPHLILLSKRHVATLSGLNTNELEEFIRIIETYTKKGYRIMLNGINQASIKNHVHVHIFKAS